MARFTHRKAPGTGKPVPNNFEAEVGIMKKHHVTHAVIFLVVFCFFFTAGGSFAKAAPAAKRHRVRSVEKIAEPPCKAYVVMEANTGKVLEEQNMHEKRAPASMAKLMTACIVFDKLSQGQVHLTDKIQVSRESASIGGSQVYLKEGEVFTLEEMMRAMLIASANDAAHAIAESIGGTTKAFVGLMNEKARALGMNDTEFASVHGLPPGKDRERRPYLLL